MGSKNLMGKRKKWTSVLAILLSALLSFPAFAAEDSTIPTQAQAQVGHWAAAYVSNLRDAGVITGEYPPDEKVTRAEFVKMSTQLFHYNKPSSKQFADVAPTDWYAESIANAAGQGFFSGDGNNALPNETLTRQDAAVMLTKMIKCSGGAQPSFADADDISDYAKDSVYALSSKGYIKGYETGDILPLKQLTKGEAARLLCAVSGKLFDKEGVYDLKNSMVNGNVTIVSAGVTLQNTKITGDLYISEGVGTGEVTLDNVSVSGDTIVSGGGMNSIVFINTKLGRLKVEVPDGTPVRVVASGDTSIGMTEVRSESKMQNDGTVGKPFREIVISIPEHAKVTLDGDFASVKLDSPSAKLDILSGKVDSVTISETSKNAEVNLAAKVTVGTLNANAAGSIGGTGKVESANVSAPNVSIAQKPNEVTVSKGVETKVNNTTIKGDGSVVKPGGGASGGSGGGSSGGGSSSGGTQPNLNFDYISIRRNASQTAVTVMFSEAVQFTVNGQRPTNAQIASSFEYQSGNNRGAVSSASVSGNTITFQLPPQLELGSYHIGLNNSSKQQNWELKGQQSGKVLKNIKGNVFPFVIGEASTFQLSGPADVEAVAGETAKFEVQAASDASLTYYYQWYRDGNKITGQTKNTYELQTALSDHDSKFHVEVWTQEKDGTRNIAVSNTALLTVKEQAEENRSVILMEGSEGAAGNACITDLTLKKRYYIFVDAETKAYVVNKDGTLGRALTEGAKYEELESLEATTIPNLKNGEKYLVVCVMPDAPKLNSLNTLGATSDYNFTGFVSNAIELELPISQTRLKLKMDTDWDDVTVLIEERRGDEVVDSRYITDAQWLDVQMDYFANKKIQITIQQNDDKENKQIYIISVSRNVATMVLHNNYSQPNAGPVDYYKGNALGYNIRYMETGQTFEGLSYKRNEEESVTMVKDTDYTQSEPGDGRIYIYFTTEFLQTLEIDDQVTFTFKFKGGTSAEKTCSIKVTQQDYYPNDKVISIGEPQLVDGSGWLSIYVPLFEDGEPVSYTKIKKAISNIYCSMYTNGGQNVYSDNHYSSSIDEDEKKGIMLYVGLPRLDRDKNSVEDMPTQFTITVSSYNFEKWDWPIGPSNQTKTTEKIPIPVDEEPLTGSIKFAVPDATEPFHEVDLSTLNDTKQAVTIDLENTPFTVSYVPGEENDILYANKDYCSKTFKDENGDNFNVYFKSDKTEYMYLFARKNTVPRPLPFDFEGSGMRDDNFIVSHDFYKSDNNSPVFYFNHYLKDQDNSTKYTVDAIKSNSLDPKNVVYTFGERNNGEKITKTMQDFLDAGIYGQGENPNIYAFQFDGIKKLFEVLDFNPINDELYQTITASIMLSDSLSGFKIGDASTTLYSNGGSVSKLVIQDKNSDAAMDVTLQEGELNEITIPYADAALITTSTGGYECVIFDQDGLPVDEKGLILTPNVPVTVAIVVSKGGYFPKIYQVELTYEPPVKSAAARSVPLSTVTVFALTDDMTEEEIAEILGSLKNGQQQQEALTEVEEVKLNQEAPEDINPGDAASPEEKKEEAATEDTALFKEQTPEAKEELISPEEQPPADSEEKNGPENAENTEPLIQEEAVSGKKTAKQ